MRYLQDLILVVVAAIFISSCQDEPRKVVVHGPVTSSGTGTGASIQTSSDEDTSTSTSDEDHDTSKIAPT